MRRRLFVISVGVVLLVAGAAAAGFASGKAQKAETELQTEAKASSEQLEALVDALEQQRMRAPIKCKTLQCINKTLTNLSKGFVAVGELALALGHEVIDCQALLPVSKYYGYQYSDGTQTFLTTALDETEPGGMVGAQVLTYTC